MNQHRVAIMLNICPVCCVTLVVMLPLQRVTAHMGAPMLLHITELPSHKLQVQWQVSKAVATTATPLPILPDHCMALDEPTRQDQMDKWLYQQPFRCQDAIDGHEVGLAPDEPVWRIPKKRSDWLREAQTFVLDGIMHMLSHWIHVAFVFALCLLHRLSWQVQWLTAFTVGQLLAGVGVVMSAITMPPDYVEALDVVQVGDVEPTAGHGFRIKVVWTVAGSVVHFGHRHYRKNQYHAWMTIVAIEGAWKLHRLDIVDEQRLL